MIKVQRSTTNFTLNYKNKIQQRLCLGLCLIWLNIFNGNFFSTKYILNGNWFSIKKKIHGKAQLEINLLCLVHQKLESKGRMEDRWEDEKRKVKNAEEKVASFIFKKKFSILRRTISPLTNQTKEYGKTIFLENVFSPISPI